MICHSGALELSTGDEYGEFCTDGSGYMRAPKQLHRSEFPKEFLDLRPMVNWDDEKYATETSIRPKN